MEEEFEATKGVVRIRK